MKKQSMKKQDLQKEIMSLRDEKVKLSMKLDNAVINSLNKEELSKLIECMKKDIELIKETLNNQKEFIKSYKSLLKM